MKSYIKYKRSFKVARATTAGPANWTFFAARDSRHDRTIKTTVKIEEVTPVTRRMFAFPNWAAYPEKESDYHDDPAHQAFLGTQAKRIVTQLYLNRNDSVSKPAKKLINPFCIMMSVAAAPFRLLHKCTNHSKKPTKDYRLLEV